MKRKTAQKRRQTRDSHEFRELRKRLGENVRRLRNELNESQEEIAHRCNMPTRVYARVEAATANATLATLARLCKGMHVSIEELWRAPSAPSSDSER